MWLNDVNPSIKALAVCICIIMLALVFDPITPLIFLIFVVILTLSFSEVPIKKWLLFFSPFILISAAYVWTAVLFPRISSEQVPTILWTWGWLDITKEALFTGSALGMRILCFASLSLLFILTTKPIHFMLSLMQQCSLPPKLAYGILAGYRFLPQFKEELLILQSAHRIRGVGRAKGLREWFIQIGRYAIPLLAGAIRKAERTAMAMESKGFTGSKARTFYIQLTVSGRDWLFLGTLTTALLLAAYISYGLGYLKLFSAAN
jgi:energy-coupling factor transport system permease protein